MLHDVEEGNNLMLTRLTPVGRLAQAHTVSTSQIDNNRRREFCNGVG